jgi:hypothetical protein
MKKVLAFLLFPLLTFAQEIDRKEWKQLFNGKNLDDWKVKIRNYDLNNNHGNTFRVEDGLMKVRYDASAYPAFNERFGHIFYKDKFSYYKIAVEYRFVGEQAIEGPGWATRNSGIMVHGQTPESMGKDQDFPISIEVQLLGGLGKGNRTTCNVCTPGTNIVYENKFDKRHCISSTSKTYDGDQWVRAEVTVLGDSAVIHYVNGEKVLEYLQPQIGGGNVSGHDEKLMAEVKLLKEGSISLQSESHPVDFRKVELLNLCGCTDPKASNYKSYFVKSDNTTCVYKKKKKNKK